MFYEQCFFLQDWPLKFGLSRTLKTVVSNNLHQQSLLEPSMTIAPYDYSDVNANGFTVINTNFERNDIACNGQWAARRAIEEIRKIQPQEAGA